MQSNTDRIKQIRGECTRIEQNATGILQHLYTTLVVNFIPEIDMESAYSIRLDIENLLRAAAYERAKCCLSGNNNKPMWV